MATTNHTENDDTADLIARFEEMLAFAEKNFSKAEADYVHCKDAYEQAESMVRVTKAVLDRLKYDSA